MTQTDVRIVSKAALACRLRHRVGRWGPSPTSGEVELENVSAEVIEIEVRLHRLQYLDLVVKDSAGAVLPTFHYGDLFSPLSKPYIFRLAPGETFVHNVSLLGTLAAEKRVPGTYTVQAVYEYNGLKAISEPLQVHLTTDD